MMKTRTITSFLVALLVVAFVATGAAAQGPVSQFDVVLADEVVATVSMTAPAVTATTATIGSLVSTSSNLGAASVTSLSNTGLQSSQRIALAQGAQQTVVASSIISVTSGIAQITAASPVTVGSIYTGTDGQMLIVLNAGANAITLPDSGTNRLSGALVLGQYDTATLVYYNGAWTQLSTSNN